MSDQKKIRIGIVGLGARGVACFGELLIKRDDVEIAALCDINPVRQRVAKERLNVEANLYNNIEEMAAKETLDAVIITTPDFTHHTLSIFALKQNWHVLVDKPLCTKAADGAELIRVAKECSKHLMIGFNLRHHATLKRLKKLIDDGELGKVFLIENREFYDFGKTYMARWNRFYEKSGGLWIHKGSHDFDIYNWLLDFPKPVRVAAFAAVNVLTPENVPFELEDGHVPGPGCNQCYYKDKCKDKWLLDDEALKSWGDEAVAHDGYLKNTCIYMSEKNTHDNGIAMVEYEGGIKASHFESFIGTKNDRCYTVVGDRGIAEVSLSQSKITVMPRWNTEGNYEINVPKEEGSHGGADPSLVDMFCRVVRGEAVPNSTAEHGLLSSSIGQAAEISRRENRMVEISELYK